MFILRVNYIFPRLKSLQGLESQKKEGRDEERKHTVIRLHTQSSTTRMHREGIIIILKEMPPTQWTPDDQGSWAGQPGSLCTERPRQQVRQAAFLKVRLRVYC